MRQGLGSLIVQVGTCALLLALVVVAEVLLMHHLGMRLAEARRDVAALHRQYPDGLPDPSTVYRAEQAVDQQLHEQLYPQLQTLVGQMTTTLGSLDANQRELSSLEAQLQAAQASEGQPPPEFLAHPFDWAAYYLDQIASLNQRLTQARQLNGQLNHQRNDLQQALSALTAQIASASSRQVSLETLIHGPDSLSELRHRWQGLGWWLLCVEHLGLAALLAGLGLRTLFRLLILLGLPGALRLA